jgi:threonine/homoserine/homoserine lactone efflux protein
VPGPTTFALFCAAALALIVVPGPAVTYVVTQSVDRGRRAGIVSALGVACGGLVHVAAASAGLSAVLASSSSAFTVVKLAGAAYLIVLGLRRLAGLGTEGRSDREPAGGQRIFLQGVVVNVLNPKTALFFLAFLPQFVEPSRGAAWHQILALGLLFGVLGFVTDGAYALVAGTLGDVLRRSRRYLQLQRWVSGVVFVALGATAALTGRVEK